MIKSGKLLASKRNWNLSYDDGFDDWIFSCFPEKYEYIGKLLKPGEQPTEYSDEEDAKDNKTKKDD